MSLENKLERGREILRKSDVEVDFIRHGEAFYDEDELDRGELEGELTPLGVEQIKNLGDRLAKEIDKNKEIVIIWTSPKKRAVQSSFILEERMKAAGVEVYRLRIKKPLRDTDLSNELIENLSNEKVEWIDFWTKNEEYPTGMEKLEGVSSRTGRIISCLNRIVRNISNIKGKKMRFLCVGHEENIGGVIGCGIDGETPFVETDNAELVRIYFNKAEKGKDIKLDIDFKNQKITVGFDEERKRFYKFQ